MKCTNPELSKFALLSDQGPDEQLPDPVREHLSLCAYCAAQRARYGKWRDLLKLESSSHLGMELLLAYKHTSLTATQEQRADKHLATCHECARAVERLGSAFDSLEKNEMDGSDSIPGWTVERERSFVARMKTELEARGQLGEENPLPRLEVVSRPPVRSRHVPRYVLAWGLGFATLILVVGVAFYFYSKRERGTPGVNQNLSAGGSQSSPSPVEIRPAENTNLTAQQPVQQPTKKTKGSLPPPEQPPSSDIQVVALVIDPTRAPSLRKEIAVSQPFIRFSVSISGPTTRRLFKLEMVDEENGKTIDGPQRVSAQLRPGHREIAFILPTKELIHTLYTLRLTGLSTSGKTAEVFTVYLKLTK